MELNDIYRNGGDPLDDQERSDDCVSHFKRAEKDHRIVANDLRDMRVPDSEWGWEEA